MDPEPRADRPDPSPARADADLQVREASFGELDATTLYEILRLRVDVFVVEQGCVFGDLDGRDREPGCRHLWIEAAGELVGYARILPEPDGTTQIGRVVTTLAARGRHVGVRLMREALTRTGDGPVVLKAQARLADWYGQFGFRREGEEFLWDGIDHVRMVRP